MIPIKTEKDIAIMAEGGKILSGILNKLAEAAVAGITTKELDSIALDLVLRSGTKPSFLGYVVGNKKFPASLCVSINDEVVHGIPSSRVLAEGDVVGLDMGLIYKRWNLDSAITVEIQNEKRPARQSGGTTKNEKLIQATREAMYLGINQAKPGNRVGDISHAVQTYVEKQGFGIVRDLVGHGVGKKLHEEPMIPNFGKPGYGPELRVGMVICIEPMVTFGDWHVVLDADEWTYRTKDGSISAHFEHTIAITKNGPIVLT